MITFLTNRKETLQKLRKQTLSISSQAKHILLLKDSYDKNELIEMYNKLCHTKTEKDDLHDKLFDISNGNLTEEEFEVFIESEEVDSLVVKVRQIIKSMNEGSQSVQQKLYEIAAESCYAVECRGDLETRWSDEEDFLDVPVWAIKAMLEKAYELGKQNGVNYER